MVDEASQKEREQAYSRELDKEKKKKSGVFGSLGSGKIGRFGKAALLAGSLTFAGGQEAKSNEGNVQRQTRQEPFVRPQRPQRKNPQGAQESVTLPAISQAAISRNAIGAGQQGTQTQPTAKSDNEVIGEAGKIRKSKFSKESGPGENYMELARKFRAAKQQSLSGQAKGVMQGGADLIGQLATARALSWAWGLVIPSFGLTVLYINIHFIARYIMNSEKFCSFGSEWMIQKAAGGTGVAKEAGTMLEIAEIGLMLLADLIIALLILGSIIIGYLIVNPIEAVDILL